jgi:hypothetical protein
MGFVTITDKAFEERRDGIAFHEERAAYATASSNPRVHMDFRKIINSDASVEEGPVLISRRYGLKGKPDAVVRLDSGDLIPIERKRHVLRACHTMAT